MMFKFGKKEVKVPWEFFAAPLLIVLAIIIVISYRMDSRSEELIKVSAISTAQASGAPASPAASEVGQVPFDEPDPDDKPANPGGSAAPSPDAESPQAAKVNINKAGMDELISLPYIGEVKAKAIIEYRNANGPFKSVADLLNVKGIGPKTLEKLRPLITII